MRAYLWWAYVIIAEFAVQWLLADVLNECAYSDVVAFIAQQCILGLRTISELFPSNGHSWLPPMENDHFVVHARKYGLLEYISRCLECDAVGWASGVYKILSQLSRKVSGDWREQKTVQTRKQKHHLVQAMQYREDIATLTYITRVELITISQ